MEYEASPYGLLETQRALREAVRENSGRPARCQATWTTTGIGEILVPTIFNFDVRFIEEPCFTYGFALADDGIDPVDGHFPRAGAGVYRWEQDAKDHYIGAYLFFTVDTIGPGNAVGNEPNYKIIHHLSFEAMAIKDVPDHLLDFGPPGS